MTCTEPEAAGGGGLAEAAGTWWRWQQRPPVENEALSTREMQILLPKMIGDFTSPSLLNMHFYRWVRAWPCADHTVLLHLIFAHLLLTLLLYLAHDMATTSSTSFPSLFAEEAIALALALVTFFTRSRHVLSAFPVSILDLKWLHKVNQQHQNKHRRVRSCRCHGNDRKLVLLQYVRANELCSQKGRLANQILGGWRSTVTLPLTSLCYCRTALCVQSDRDPSNRSTKYLEFNSCQRF
jgi:hypothetical protein